MLRTILYSKIHMATITDCQLNYEGSITVDEDIIDIAEMSAYEQVHVSNLNNGERFITYLIPGRRGSKEIILNGPTARLGMPGDRIIIFSYAIVEKELMKDHRPKIIVLDEHNNVVSA